MISTCPLRSRLVLHPPRSAAAALSADSWGFPVGLQRQSLLSLSVLAPRHDHRGAKPMIGLPSCSCPPRTGAAFFPRVLRWAVDRPDEPGTARFEAAVDRSRSTPARSCLRRGRHPTYTNNVYV